jgi:DNA-binding protein H-NS
MARSLGIKQLIEKQKKLDQERREVNAQIKKVLTEEKNERYAKFGEAMEKMFKSDPKCTNTLKIQGLCSKYLFDDLESAFDESKETDNIAEYTK